MWGANTAHKFVQLPNDILWRYNAFDSYATARLAGALTAELQDPKVRNYGFYQQWIRPLMRSVVNMQQRGILVDKEKREEFREENRAELHEIDQLILDYVDASGFKYTDTFLNSDPQKARFLFGHCELKPAGYTDGGTTGKKRPKVDQLTLLKVLRRLRKKDEEHREVLLNFLHRTRLQTIKERYLDFPTSPDSRLRANVKMCGAKTFRYAIEGPALQQFPDEVRRFFVAKPRHLLLAIDKSQVEARVLAELSGDELSLAAFREGRDIHTENALDFLGYTQDQWEALPKSAIKPSRNYAKSKLYKLQYGGDKSEKEKFSCPCPRCVEKTPPMLSLTREQDLASEDRWYQKHHWVKAWQNDLCKFVRERHYYESPFGVRRWIFSPWSPATERETKNIPMQMNTALMMIQDQVLLGDAPIILQHHDSFIFEIPESPGRLVDERVAEYSAIMERPVPEFGGAVFPVKPAIGRNWSDASPTNPDGLREL